jgi:hypothetical protein
MEKWKNEEKWSSTEKSWPLFRPRRSVIVAVAVQRIIITVSTALEVGRKGEEDIFVTRGVCCCSLCSIASV